MLISFKTCNPTEFIQDNGYKANISIKERAEALSFLMLDGSSETFMDVMLTALIDLVAEGKTITDVRYKGKGARRWFRMVFPPILSPIFFGILDPHNTLIGYLVAIQSVISTTRKALGIALVKSYRGQGIGYQVFKHVQNNLDKIFQPEINELVVETSRTNLPMMAIAEKLGFVEFHLPQDSTWGDPPSDWIRFLWIRP